MKRLIKWKATPKEKRALRKLLSGEQGLRPTAKELGCSHTQVVNIVYNLAVEKYQKGQFKI